MGVSTKTQQMRVAMSRAAHALSDLWAFDAPSADGEADPVTWARACAEMDVAYRGLVRAMHEADSGVTPGMLAQATTLKALMHLNGLRDDLHTNP